MTDSLSVFVTHPTGEKTEYLLEGELRVGRLAECEIRVMSPNLSRTHFVLRPSAHGYEVHSNHQLTQMTTSTNRRVLGTFVNGEMVHGPRAIVSGDRISPVENPGPDHPVFLIGPTQSPTPVDQLPNTSKGNARVLIVVGCAMLLLTSLLVMVIAGGLLAFRW